ncbi:MAG: hypothetical protein IKO80_06885 [Lachnospiraceae bacterium]|nr:hypothetical protein [Lachnospiraceae bacterium]
MKSKNPVLQLFYCLFVAFLVLVICSRSSFLYPFNIWDDANGFLTMGKSMIHGMVPYRDLFEPKGILLYVLYAVGYLISHTTFAGVFVIEVIAAGAVLFFAMQILIMYVEEQTACILLPIFAALVYSSRSFYWGGSAEEFMLPYLMCGLYVLLRHISTNPMRPMSLQDVACGGFCAGCILHIKFNSLGFYIGWVIAVSLIILVANEEHRFWVLVQSAAAFLAGVLVITVPFAVYFGIHGAIGDWFRCCIYDNVFIYSKSLPLGERILQMCRTIFNQTMYNKRFMIPIAAGLILDLVMAVMKRDRRENLVLASDFLTCTLLAVGIFVGGIDLPYYPFPVSIFAVIGFARGGVLLEMAWEELLKKHEKVSRERRDKDGIALIGAAAAAVAVAAAVFICFFGSPNAGDIGTKQEDLFQFKMRKYILAQGIEDPKLINMGLFDAGLYTVLDSVPECYYYQTTTMPIPGVWETQKEYVKSGRPDYVLSTIGYLDFNTSGYRVVMQEQDDSTGVVTDYWLYEKIRE